MHFLMQIHNNNNNNKSQREVHLFCKYLNLLSTQVYDRWNKAPNTENQPDPSRHFGEQKNRHWSTASTIIA